MSNKSIRPIAVFGENGVIDTLDEELEATIKAPTSSPSFPSMMDGVREVIAHYGLPVVLSGDPLSWDKASMSLQYGKGSIPCGLSSDDTVYYINFGGYRLAYRKASPVTENGVLALLTELFEIGGLQGLMRRIKERYPDARLVFLGLGDDSALQLGDYAVKLRLTPGRASVPSSWEVQVVPHVSTWTNEYLRLKYFLGPWPGSVDIADRVYDLIKDADHRSMVGARRCVRLRKLLASNNITADSTKWDGVLTAGNWVLNSYYHPARVSILIESYSKSPLDPWDMVEHMKIMQALMAEAKLGADPASEELDRAEIVSGPVTGLELG